MNNDSRSLSLRWGQTYIPNQDDVLSSSMAQDIGGIQQRVKEEINDANGTLDQDRLVNRLTSSGISEADVLEAVRIMMEERKVSYDIDWDLQLEE